MTLDAIPSDICPDCGGRLSKLHVDQPALFRHAGYGATERTILRHCPCGWALIVERSEVKP